MAELVFGVDVSKDWVDVARGAGGVTRHLRADGYGALALEIAGAGGIAVFEASGGADMALAQALAAAGARYARVDPARARHFAKGEGMRAKTDRVDARMLWRLGQVQTPAETPPLPEAASKLKALHVLRAQIVESRKVVRTQAKDCPDPVASAVRSRILACLDAEVALLDDRIAATIAADPALRRTAGHLRSCPGVGPVTACALLALCPELGHIGQAQIAALAGLAPFARDSGRRTPARHIGGGRKPLRDILYMAALAASRTIPELTAFKSRLTDAGKSPKQAIIAVARKLIIMLNTIVREDRDYQPFIP